jgi:hypothetical protein
MNQAAASPVKPLARFNLGKALPILALLNPHQLTPAVILSIVLGVALAWVVTGIFQQPLWVATLIVLLSMLPVGIFKWRADLRSYGKTAMIISIILAAQGTHTIEHVVQWIQYYLLLLPARQSVGLLSPANSEWVHFIWNWLVLIVVLVLIKGGLRNFFAFLLLGVAIAHTAEHTYMFIRYQIVLNQLAILCVTGVTGQGLPGILGRDGLLARSDLTRGTLLGTLPGLTTAMRLDVHFWWNMLEMSLMLVASHIFLKQTIFKRREEKAEINNAKPDSSMPAAQPSA